MSWLGVLLIGIFLPLFPLSIGFNHVLARVERPLLKCGLLLLWPQVGLLLFFLFGIDVPAWVLPWAALTALLYGFRLLAQREMQGWVVFLATSTWSLLWFLLSDPGQDKALVWSAIGLSAPLMLLVMLAAELEQRFGAAYTHLYGGLAITMPRFAGVLVFGVLAAVATPIFPAFFLTLKILILAKPVTAIIILLTWLLWSWAGIRLLQGLLVGEDNHTENLTDLQRGFTGVYSLVLVVLAISGLYAMGGVV